MNTSARIATPSNKKSGNWTTPLILSAASGWRAMASAAAAANYDIPSAAPITVIPSPIGTNKVASIVYFLFLLS